MGVISQEAVATSSRARVRGQRAEVIIEECELTDGGEYSVICTQDNDTYQYVTSANLTVDGNGLCPSGVFFFFFSISQLV